MKENQKTQVQLYGAVLHTIDPFEEMSFDYFRTNETNYEVFQNSINYINQKLEEQTDLILALRLGRSPSDRKFYGICCILDLETFKAHINEE